MSRKRRTFSSEFKTKIVLDIIEGRKSINEIATEHKLQPNLVRNWKSEFLDKASTVFDDKREDNTRQKLQESRKERDEYARKVGQLTMQVDWLKKKSEETVGPNWESQYSKKPFDD